MAQQLVPNSPPKSGLATRGGIGASGFTRERLFALPKRVGVDSDAMTFLVEAMSHGYVPATDPSSVSAERVAMLRVFLYSTDSLYITPTVRKQYEYIANNPRRGFHWDVDRFFLVEAFGNADPPSIDARVAYLRTLHSGDGDCRIAAEAELAGLRLLLSRDEKFAKRLNGALRPLTVVRPSEYWTALAVPRGTRPRFTPAPANPLSAADWWRW